jgi:O-acetyl-ADP-ribose deacetylase (regulator of RNase III)
MSVNVSVIPGDITRQPADALITAINSGGMWLGGIDSAIQRVSGSIFHAQAASHRLRDGNVVVATGGPVGEGRFSNIVFIIDDLRLPLSALVCSGLIVADKAGMKRVTLPTIRTGVMAGMVEPTVEAALQGMVKGIRIFTTTRVKSITGITIVVYNDPKSEQLLKDLLLSGAPVVD